MAVQISVIMAYAVGIVLLYLAGRFLLVPMKILMKLVYNGIIGGIVLVLINLVGSLFGFHIALNIFTALITGFLGIPGLILIIILKYIIGV